MARTNPMMDSVEEEEAFERRLQELAAMSPEEKRREAKNIDKRETAFAERVIENGIRAEYQREEELLEAELEAEANGTDD